MSAANDIPAAKLRLKQMQEQRDELDIAIRELANDIAEAESQFKVGDLITWKSGQSRRKGRIVMVVPWCGSGAKYEVIRIRADGTEGAQVCVHNWKSNDIRFAERAS